MAVAAKWVEQLTTDPKIEGSNLATVTRIEESFLNIPSQVEGLLVKLLFTFPKFGGSSPANCAGREKMANKPGKPVTLPIV